MAETISIKKYQLEVGRLMNAHRFVMSWIRTGGDLKDGATEEFIELVNSLKWPEKDKKLILFMANNGKLEYEELAKKFMAK